jgi:hypothetical protein
MSLFRISDIQIPAQVEPKGKQRHDRAVRIDVNYHDCKLCAKGERIAQLIPIIDSNSCWHIVSDGSWSGYHLVEHMASLAAPAELWMTTWGISDPGVRSIDRMISAGHVTAVYAVVDGHTAVQHSGAAAFLDSIAARFGTLPCHAKAYILLGPELSISIISSANLTNNPNLETGIVIESAAVAEFHCGWIKQALDRAKPYKAKK